MLDLILILVIASSIWVFADALKIGVKKGQLNGVCDVGPAGWFFACLFMWIIGFPLYLASRSELKRINGKNNPLGDASSAPVASRDSQDFEIQLIKLSRLRESGLVSEEEFNAKKKAILNL